MNRIFIEAKSNQTPEYHFLHAILDQYFSNKEVGFVFMDGIGNLFSETILNQLHLAEDYGDRSVLLADADTIAKGWGFVRRNADIIDGLSRNGIELPFFLYPNHHDDGEVETLMERAARRDLHPVFFDCFEDYERCISGQRDATGQPLYNLPNLKSKLHTYMNSQQLSSRFRNKLGHGDWLFSQPQYWNLSVDELQPLRDFLAANLI